MLWSGLDDMIMDVMHDAEFVWWTKGEGGNTPRLSKFIWQGQGHCSRYGARFDMHRGNPDDDKKNKIWRSWIVNHMPRLLAWLGESDESEENAMGNVMEGILGICYAVATAGMHLPGYLQITVQNRREQDQKEHRWNSRRGRCVRKSGGHSLATWT